MHGPQAPSIHPQNTPHLARLLAEAAHHGVAVWPPAGSIIVVLHNHRLLAGIPAAEQDDHLARLQILTETLK